MAILWQSSLVPWLDPCGDPYAGARAFFYNAGTTTPRTTYTDGDLSVPHDHPVVANGSGRFPATFLAQGQNYRVRIETASGVTIADVDGISIPDIDGQGGGGGDTPIEQRFQTGDVKERYGVGAHAGWVRLNGRTLGNGLSGASERANDDTEALFVHLWNVDSSLAVSGGRGSSAASDFAANKSIALPDYRLFARIAPSGMGNTPSTRIPAESFSGDDGDVLGATAGAASVALSVNQMPAHNHTGSIGQAGQHSHAFDTGNQTGGGDIARGQGARLSSSVDSAGAHTHPLTINNRGGGQAHPNVQPSKTLSLYMKL